MKQENFLISFCVTCMGRKYHLEKTLQINLDIISKYNDIELVLLDYNSRDGLSKWIKKYFLSDIRRGFLSFFMTSEPRYFFMSHAKNIAHKLSQGKFVCNLATVDIPAKYKSDISYSDFDRERNGILSSKELSETLHKKIMSENIRTRKTNVNKERQWGVAIVERNFGLLDSNKPPHQTQRNSTFLYKASKKQ